MKPSVSVIMNCFNGEKYLREALNSVFAQTFSDWEIVFFDNASTDCSGEIARSYGPKLRYIHHARTVDLGEGRTEAVRHAQGEFVAFLDVDDEWLPRKLENQLPLFERPSVGVVYSDAWIIDAAGCKSGKRFSDGDSRRLRSGYIRNELLAWGGFLCLSSAVARRELVAQVGWFEPSFTIVEDTDMWFKLADVTEFACCTEPLACYRLHGTNSIFTRRERHFRETIALLSREIRRGRIDQWSRTPAHVRLFEASWNYAALLRREHRRRDAVRCMKDAMAFAPVRFTGWLSAKSADWIRRRAEFK